MSLFKLCGLIFSWAVLFPLGWALGAAQLDRWQTQTSGATGLTLHLL